MRYIKPMFEIFAVGLQMAIKKLNQVSHSGGIYLSRYIPYATSLESSCAEHFESRATKRR